MATQDRSTPRNEKNVSKIQMSLRLQKIEAILIPKMQNAQKFQRDQNIAK